MSNLFVYNTVTYYNIPFKHSISGQTCIINVDMNMSVSSLKEHINSLIIQNFNINEYDIIEAGLPQGENAQALDETMEISLSDYYKNSIQYITFYIRPRSIV